MTPKARRASYALGMVVLLSMLVLGCGSKKPKKGASTPTNPKPIIPNPGGSGLPSVNKVREAAHRTDIMNNLKQIGMAMHDYHGTNRSFPPQGTKLSWRVELLPYLEQRNLYNQFDRTQPWNSPKNKALLKHMPKVYALPGSDDARNFETHYQVIAGQRTIYPERSQGNRGPVLQRITDGTVSTILVAEAKKPVPWTKPEDLTYRGPQAMPELGGFYATSFYVLMADGSVRRLPLTIPPQTLSALITATGGEIVPQN